MFFEKIWQKKIFYEIFWQKLTFFCTRLGQNFGQNWLFAKNGQYCQK